MPRGVAAAQIIHAAGESSPGSLPEHTFAVALSVDNEQQLVKLSHDLRIAGVKHTLVREPDAPWCGAAMTIGVVPDVRSKLRPHLKRLRLYR